MPGDLTRQDNGHITLKIVIPWPQIDTAYQSRVAKAVEETEIPGFRKGKAPREVVEPKLDKSVLMSQALSELLPIAYADLVKKHDLKPILYPQIHIDKGATGQDFEFTATTCEAPKVTLPPDFKDEIKKLKPVIPNEKLGVIMEYLRQQSQIKVPDLLVDEETNHRLSRLAENLTQLGLDIQKYLQTKKMSPQTLKDQTINDARTDLEIELILNQIREVEHLPDRAKTIEFLQNLLPTG